jgi:pimeloyl-ACP methyl ester carboxylesterase
MTTSTEQVRLADGRDLEVLLGGDPTGLPIVLHHGTPGHATTYADWDGACVSRGLRLVAAARPGYGASARAPGRRVADAAADTAALLDHLGAGEFLTAGWSGGGPHALACAALLPGRCLAAASLAGVGAYGQSDLDFLAGMGEENVDEFGVATKGEAALRDWMAVNAEPMRQATATELAEAFGGLVPQVDKDVLNQGYADVLHASMQRGLQDGFDGWIDDDLAFVQPWGFELGAIGVPVRIWQGELDLMVPQAHAPWLAGKIPGADSRVVPGHGHLSLVTAYRGEILDDLAAAGGR